MPAQSDHVLTSVSIEIDDLEALGLIGSSLYDEDVEGSSNAAMIRRAVKEFIEKEKARPDFREKAESAARRREETLRRLLGEDAS